METSVDRGGRKWRSLPMNLQPVDPLRKPPAAVDLDRAGTEFDPAPSGLWRRRQFLFDPPISPVGSRAARDAGTRSA